MLLHTPRQNHLYTFHSVLITLFSTFMLHTIGHTIWDQPALGYIFIFQSDMVCIKGLLSKSNSNQGHMTKGIFKLFLTNIFH